MDLLHKLNRNINKLSYFFQAKITFLQQICYKLNLFFFLAS